MPNDYENKSYLKLNITSSRNYFTRKIVRGKAEYKCKREFMFISFRWRNYNKNYKLQLGYKFNINYHKL